MFYAYIARFDMTANFKKIWIVFWTKQSLSM